MTITIYHNPQCGTSRNALGLIRNSGVEPEIVEYLKTPPPHEKLVALISAMGISARELLREKGTPYKDLGLDNPALSDEQLIDVMLQYPILINRPIVDTVGHQTLPAIGHRARHSARRPTRRVSQRSG